MFVRTGGEPLTRRSENEKVSLEGEMRIAVLKRPCGFPAAPEDEHGRFPLIEVLVHKGNLYIFCTSCEAKDIEHVGDGLRYGDTVYPRNVLSSPKFGLVSHHRISGKGFEKLTLLLHVGHSGDEDQTWSTRPRNPIEQRTRWEAVADLVKGCLGE